MLVISSCIGAPVFKICRWVKRSQLNICQKIDISQSYGHLFRRKLIPSQLPIQKCKTTVRLSWIGSSNGTECQQQGSVHHFWKNTSLSCDSPNVGYPRVGKFQHKLFTHTDKSPDLGTSAPQCLTNSSLVFNRLTSIYSDSDVKLLIRFFLSCN